MASTGPEAVTAVLTLKPFELRSRPRRTNPRLSVCTIAMPWLHSLPHSLGAPAAVSVPPYSNHALVATGAPGGGCTLWAGVVRKPIQLAVRDACSMRACCNRRYFECGTPDPSRQPATRARHATLSRRRLATAGRGHAPSLSRAPRATCVLATTLVGSLSLTSPVATLARLPSRSLRRTPASSRASRGTRTATRSSSRAATTPCACGTRARALRPRRQGHGRRRAASCRTACTPRP